MQKQTIISAFLISFAIFLGMTGNFLKTIGATQTMLSPFSDNISIFSMINQRERPKYVVYGYLPYWTITNAKYLHLDKLTDIAYFGLNIDSKGNILTIGDDGNIDPGYNNWRNNKTLKDLIKNAQNNGVRISLTVISHTSETSDAFLMCESCWDNLVDNLQEEMAVHNIKDINMNFEYAEYTDERYADQYTKLVDYVNKKMDEKYGESYVVVATFADSLVKPRVTKVQDLSKVADGIFIMAYDFHRPDSDTAGPVAPVGGKGVHAEYDIQTMIQDYSKVASTEKLILGVPYYGYNWVVRSQNPLATRIPGNDYIGYSQSQTYSYIMETILTNNPLIGWDSLGLSPYFSYVSKISGMNRQVYFDNVESLKVKYELVKKNNFAGVGIWALGYDGGYQELWNLLETEFIKT